MKMIRSSQVLSSVTALSLILSTVASPVQAALGSAAALPTFVKELTPPVQLGYVESYFKGKSDKPVIVIQDLHANTGVQRNIIGMLKALQPKLSSASNPLILGSEGAWGEIDLTPFRSRSEKVKKVATETMLKDATISGMEYFAINSEMPVRYVGIDDEGEHKLHGEVYRQSMSERMQLAAKVDGLRDIVNASKKNVSREMKRMWRLESAYQEGRMDLNGLAKELGAASLSNYGEAEAALQKKKAEIAEREKSKTQFVKNVAQADQQLNLLARLLRQQLTLEEVQFAAKQMPQAVTVLQALLPNENLSVWQNAIRASLDYYAIALVRDEPLSKKTLEIVNKNPNSSVVVLMGGFHAAGVAKAFRAADQTYVIMAPIVSEHTIADEARYIRRMTDVNQILAENADEVRGTVKGSTNQAQTVLAPTLPGAPAPATEVFEAAQVQDPAKTDDQKGRLTVRSGTVRTVKSYKGQSNVKVAEVMDDLLSGRHTIAEIDADAAATGTLSLDAIVDNLTTANVELEFVVSGKVVDGLNAFRSYADSNKNRNAVLRLTQGSNGRAKVVVMKQYNVDEISETAKEKINLRLVGKEGSQKVLAVSAKAKSGVAQARIAQALPQALSMLRGEKYEELLKNLEGVEISFADVDSPLLDPANPKRILLPLQFLEQGTEQALVLALVKELLWFHPEGKGEREKLKMFFQVVVPRMTHDAVKAAFTPFGLGAAPLLEAFAKAYDYKDQGKTLDDSLAFQIVDSLLKGLDQAFGTDWMKGDGNELKGRLPLRALAAKFFPSLRQTDAETQAVAEQAAAVERTNETIENGNLSAPNPGIGAGIVALFKSAGGYVALGVAKVVKPSNADIIRKRIAEANRTITAA